MSVCLERSPELVAALHAVLKAGGAFVPAELVFPRAPEVREIVRRIESLHDT